MTLSKIIALNCAFSALLASVFAQEVIIAGSGDRMCRGGTWNQSDQWENPAGTRVLVRSYPPGYVDNNSPDPTLIDQIHLLVVSLDSNGNVVPNSFVFLCSDTLGIGHDMYAYFIDNDSVLYRSSGGGAAIRVRNINGTVEYTDNAAGGAPRDFAPSRKEMLVAGWVSGSGPLRAFKTDSETWRTVANLADFESFKAQMTGSDNPADWAWSHLYWSPSGNKIFVSINTAGSTNDEHFFIVNPDGSSKTYMGSRDNVKLMHATLWSDTELFGANEGMSSNHDIVTYNISTGVRTVRGGTGNHNAFGPGKGRVAGESWYGSSPVVLRVYTVGNKTPSHSLINQAAWSYTGTKAGHWFHIDPAFSHDGSALYYNKPITVGGVRKCYVARYKF